ncbi:MAG: hypothetical protein EOO71_25535 [Myxococcaceae bacterium]|nr:MAG: hypothetical protein EOO71_25535 [Myxococcaceae bacterium]
MRGQGWMWMTVLGLLGAGVPALADEQEELVVEGTVKSSLKCSLTVHDEQTKKDLRFTPNSDSFDALSALEGKDKVRLYFQQEKSERIVTAVEGLEDGQD